MKIDHKIYLMLTLLITCSNIFAEQCPVGEYLVTEHDRSEYVRKDGTYVSASDVTSYCKSYRNGLPLKIEFQRKMPLKWPHKKEKFRKCTKSERKKILEVTTSISKTLTNVGTLKISCAEKSDIENNPSTSSPFKNIIVFYDLAFKEDVKRILTHELAHIFYSSLSNDENESYMRASEWKTKPGQPPYTDRILFSAHDGALSPEEDFSNNVEMYYSEPKRFQNIFPKIFKWIDLKLGEKK